MVAVSIYLICSVAVLASLTTLFLIEDHQGQKILLPRVRAWFDRVITSIFQKVREVLTRFGKGFLRILFHYSIHNVLQYLLRALRYVEARIEALAHRNHQTAHNPVPKQHRTHLDEMTAHKEDVRLSDEEKERMRSHESN